MHYRDPEELYQEMREARREWAEMLSSRAEAQRPPPVKQEGLTYHWETNASSESLTVDGETISLNTGFGKAVYSPALVGEPSGIPGNSVESMRRNGIVGIYSASPN